MYFLFNIIWFFLGGFVLFFGYLLLGVLLCLTVVGIPFGIQCIKMALLSAAPFGRRIECMSFCDGVISTPLNVIWALLGGLVLAVLHTLIALVLALTLIGLPFARQHIKLAALALAPSGRQVVYRSR